MCKGKHDNDTVDHLHYPAPIREAARLLGYGDRAGMAALLGAAVATGLETFGRENAWVLVSTGICTKEATRAAQAAIVEFATMMEVEMKKQMSNYGWPVDKAVEEEVIKE